MAQPLQGAGEKSQDYNRTYPRTFNAQEMSENRQLPELRDKKNSVHELGGPYMPGSSHPPPPP